MPPVLLVFALVAPATEGAMEARASLGAGIDTNARRTITGPGIGEAVTDGLLLVTADLGARLRTADGHLFGQLGVGAKRFLSEATEDLLAYRGQVEGRLHLGRGWFLAGRGWGRLSRIRNGRRDYELGEATGELGWRARRFEAALFGGASGFGFGPDPRFDFVGAGVGGRIGWRPLSGLSLTAQGGFRIRDYAGNGLVFGVSTNGSPPVLTFCEDPAALRAQGIECSSGPRQDDEARFGATVRWTGRFLVEVGYLGRIQRSTSELENVDRHRFTALATFALPARFDLSVRAALQVNDSVTPTDNLFLAEADEDQNLVQAQLQRPIGELLTLEARYALFANQFGGVAAEYLRHTVYLGVLLEL